MDALPTAELSVKPMPIPAPIGVVDAQMTIEPTIKRRRVGGGASGVGEEEAEEAEEEGDDEDDDDEDEDDDDVNPPLTDVKLIPSVKAMTIL